jgi:hypothetical protein
MPTHFEDAGTAEKRFAGPSFDALMIELGFDCSPFSSRVEYGDYKYETAQAENDE